MKTLFISLLLMSQSYASTTFNLDRALETGVDSPEGKAPWASATFVDKSVNKISVSVSNSLTGDEFISSLSFNIDPKFNIKDFSINEEVSVGCTFPIIDLNSPAVHSGMGSKFDFNLFFARNNANRFNSGDRVSFVMSYNGKEFGFNSNSFNVLDEVGLSYSMAHIQSIGSCNTSAWITTTGGSVPEPSYLSVFGLILLVRRKR